MSSQDRNKPVQEKESHRQSFLIKHWEPSQPPSQSPSQPPSQLPSQSPSQSQSQPQWSQQYLSQSSQLLPSLRSSQQQYPYPSQRFSSRQHSPYPLYPYPSSQQQSPYPSSQQQSPYPSSQQQLPYPSSQQQLPYPSYSSQHLQHPSTQLLSDEEIDNLLVTLFLQIEDIMSRAVNPVYVRQSIAERFAMTLPEHLHDQIEQMIHRGKRFSEERSHTSSSSTPIMTTPTLTRTDSMDTLEEIPLITQSSTSTSSLGIAIPSVTSSTLPQMNPMDDMEEEFLSSGLQLPKFYLKNRRYPTSIRPYANSPEKFTDLINELKSLFLRTRNLDKSNNNQIIEDFLASLLPTFMNDHPDILHNVAKSFRKTWSYWRNTLWDNIKLRYETYQKRKEKDESLDFKPYLKGRHIEEIFNLWLKFLDKPISQENENSLKNLILFGFHCLEIYNSDARDHFFTHTGNLYTVNNIFNNLSGYNIGSSIDLSKYEIENNDDDDSNSSSEDEPKPKSKKSTKKRKK
ncbi:serine/threonine protein kinase [Rhizophagus irregularis DAOM 181602=DAOM 197198]|nr:serine/threonine protein kinase [Rhizophagus irregularis DAOM 181602=DAOM 197198]